MRRLLALLIVLSAACAFAEVSTIPDVRFGSIRHPKVNQNTQLQFEGFFTLNENRDNGSGARAEVLINY